MSDNQPVKETIIVSRRNSSTFSYEDADQPQCRSLNEVCVEIGSVSLKATTATVITVGLIIALQDGLNQDSDALAYAVPAIVLLLMGSCCGERKKMTYTALPMAGAGIISTAAQLNDYKGELSTKTDWEDLNSWISTLVWRLLAASGPVALPWLGRLVSHLCYSCRKKSPEMQTLLPTTNNRPKVKSATPPVSRIEAIVAEKVEQKLEEKHKQRLAERTERFEKRRQAAVINSGNSSSSAPHHLRVITSGPQKVASGSDTDNRSPSPKSAHTPPG